MRYNITVLPGDGIGPEVIGEALGVLEVVGRKTGCEFKLAEALMGGCAIDAYGLPLPEATLDACKKSDAVLMGAVGGPKWDGLPGSKRPEAGLLALRAGLGLYANLRPAVIYASLKTASPLHPDVVANGIDLLVVRELTGGIYFGKRGRGFDQTLGETAYDTESYGAVEIERIAKVAFETASKRKRRVTSVDKANVLESSRLWREVVTRVASDHPEVELSHMYVDNAAMQLIRRPEQFDVIVTTNMFGDILSDEASMITGSIGMLPSASLGEGSPGLYEPIHGSAPDIAGRDRANPIAAILSSAMLLRHSLGLETEALAIEDAVDKILERGYRTEDIASKGTEVVGCKKMGELVIRELEAGF